MTTAPTRQAPSWRERTPHLTARQREVLDLIAKGRSNPEIANALGVSLDGAKWHVREIMAELDVPTREDAAEWWREYNGLPARLRRFAGGVLGTGAIRWMVAGTAGVGVLAATALMVVAIANRGDEPSTGEPLAPESATVTPTPSPSATPSPADTPTPETASGVHPPGTRTGDPLIDGIIAAVESRDDAAFKALFAPTAVPCDVETFSIFPDCPAGTNEGTELETVYSFQCEAMWVAVSDFSPPLFSGDDFRLRSVVAGDFPLGRETPPRRSAATSILFVNDALNRPAGFAVALTSEGIVSFGRSCGATVDDFWMRWEGSASSFIIAPTN